MSDNAVAVGGYAAVKGLLEGSRGHLARVLPRHLTAERAIGLALTMYRKTPDLQKCDPLTIVNCVVAASQLGLEIDGVLGHAYLVPFGRQAQLIVGYKGFIALALRSGKIHSLGAQVVYEGDEFGVQYGTDQRLIHKPKIGDRGKPVAVYSLVHPKEGPIDFEVMDWEEIQAHKARFARKGGPWHTDEIEMARKTPIRRHAKRLPLSVEFQRAAMLDDFAERGIDQEFGDGPGLTRTDAVAARIGARPPACTPAQRERMRELSEARGLTEDGCRELLERVGCEHPEALTAAQAGEIIAELEREPAGA